MRKCDDCRYRNEPEYNKPCVVYRADCPMYEKEGDGMIKEEIIKELSEMRTDAWTDTRQMEALEMAVKALEQEPNCPYYVIDEDGHGLCMNHSEQKYCQDCKHNDDFDNDICLECEYDGHTRGMTRYELQEPSGETVSLKAYEQVMWERDIAIGQLKELGYEFGQKIEPSGDLISRDAILDIVNNPLNIRLDEIIKKLPSVNPQEPKTGHWIDCSNGWMCSECHRDNTYDTDFCPHCGAKMVEPQESEDKE